MTAMEFRDDAHTLAVLSVSTPRNAGATTLATTGGRILRRIVGAASVTTGRSARNAG